MSEIKATELRKDDIVVIKYKGVLSDDAYKRLKEHYKRTFGKQEILLIEEGGEIEILRKVE